MKTVRKTLTQLSTLLLIRTWMALLSLSMLEFFIVTGVHHVNYSLKTIVHSAANGLLIAFYATIAAVLPLIFVKREHRYARIFIHIVPVTCVFLSACMSFYFAAVLQPLDRSLFSHSVDEAIKVMRDYGTFEWYYLSLPLPLLVYAVSGKINFRFLEKSGFTISLLAVILGVMFWITPFPGIRKTNFKRTLDFYLATSKLGYFIVEAASSDEFEQMNLSKATAMYRRKYPNKSFISKKYPLTYIDTALKSSIKPFFNFKEKPPNVVLLLIEGLSSEFSGKYGGRLSFTPFLDSLSQHSLNFHNSLSTSDRTFAVLPSVTGSLPHGKRGFTSTGLKMPEHYTINRVLQENGYSSAFFYGGDASYSNYDIFMERQGNVKFIEHSEFGISEVTGQNPKHGIDDDELFKEALKTVAKETSPYIHTYLTLSMHYPFEFSGQDEKIKRAKKIIQRSDLNNDVKEEYNSYLNVFSTMMFTDESLRDFFNTYAEFPEYENTVFVITGDHRVFIPHPASGMMEFYRVPIMIYSPLLNQSKDFFAVNSHLDIAPSMLRLFKSSFPGNYPDTVHWLGSDFDTADVFRNKRSLVFMRNNRDANEYVNGKFYIRKDRIFEFNDKMQLQSVENDSAVSGLSEEFAAMRALSQYSVHNNKLLPNADSKNLLYENKQVQYHDMSGGKEFSSHVVFELDTAYSELEFMLHIDFPSDYNKDRILEEVLMVVSIQDSNGEKKKWDGEGLSRYIYMDEHGKEQFELHHVIKKSRNLNLEKGDVIKLYFWNFENADLDFNYRLLKLKIKGAV